MHTVPELGYEYDALEPHISAAIMELHHDKHHKTYVDKLNAALSAHDEWSELPVEELLRSIDRLPEELRTPVRNHGGGHYNHSLFWKVLSPTGGGRPGGLLLMRLRRSTVHSKPLLNNLMLQPSGCLAVAGSG